MNDKPTMLVVVCRDDIIRRGSASILFDIRSLTPRREEFNRFVGDVASALRRAGHDALALEALNALDS